MKVLGVPIIDESGKRPCTADIRRELDLRIDELVENAKGSIAYDRPYV